MLQSITVAAKSWSLIFAIAMPISLAACGGGGGGDTIAVTDPASGSQGPAAPVQPAAPSADTIPLSSQYEITIAGHTVPGGAISVVADLVVLPTVATSATAASNGVNPVEIGIFTRPSPIAGNAGALSFATNTALASHIGSNLGASSVDVAFVDAKQNAGTVDITLDGKAFGLPDAQVSTLNIYKIASGASVQTNNILTGLVNLRFSNSGQDVSGDIILSGFGGPAVASSYQATFTGTRVK
jgi:hypothetical protein